MKNRQRRCKMQKAEKKDFYDSIGTDGKAAAGMHFYRQ